MFENLRRGREARHFTINVPKILDLTDIFRKLTWVPLSFNRSQRILAISIIVQTVAYFEASP